MFRTAVFKANVGHHLAQGWSVPSKGPYNSIDNSMLHRASCSSGQQCGSSPRTRLFSAFQRPLYNTAVKHLLMEQKFKVHLSLPFQTPYTAALPTKPHQNCPSLSSLNLHHVKGQTPCQPKLFTNSTSDLVLQNATLRTACLSVQTTLS